MFSEEAQETMHKALKRIRRDHIRFNTWKNGIEDLVHEMLEEFDPHLAPHNHSAQAEKRHWAPFEGRLSRKGPTYQVLTARWAEEEFFKSAPISVCPTVDNHIEIFFPFTDTFID